MKHNFFKSTIGASAIIWSSMIFNSSFAAVENTIILSVPFTKNTAACNYPFMWRDGVEITMTLPSQDFLNPYTKTQGKFEVVTYLTNTNSFDIHLSEQFCHTYFDPILKESVANNGYVQIELEVITSTKNVFVCDKWSPPTYSRHCLEGHSVSVPSEVVNLKFSNGIVLSAETLLE